jgi:error-prone DNA polymerase
MFAELCARTNYSFLEGASHPEEMVERASELGLAALAIADRDDVGGVVRAQVAARRAGLRLGVGATLTLHDAPPLTLLCRDARGWARLCRLLTRAKARDRLAPSLPFDEAIAEPEGLCAIAPPEIDETRARALRDRFGKDAALAIPRLFAPGEGEREARAQAIARRTGLPLLATAAPLMHDAARQPLHDVLAAIRHGTPLSEMGYRLGPNAERRLRSPAEMVARYADLPAALETGLRLASRCDFSLAELRFVYPREHLPPGETPASYLRHLSCHGARRRWGDPLPAAVVGQLEHELALIGALSVEGFFLTMYEIVRFARERGILCQGRGSAANSVVCYALDITAVDPIRYGLLFERFLSVERGEPPDIDVDFEHERREEVIQHVYTKYGRDHAGMVCETISYRPRSAIRDVGKALSLSLAEVDRLAKGSLWFDGETLPEGRMREAGLAPDDRRARLLGRLVAEIQGFPRHRSIHVGGMVITDRPLCDVAPFEPAAMPGRTIIPWNKDDCDALQIFKFDLLGLGMLTCIRKAFALLHGRGVDLELGTLPADDPATYEMIGRADTIGAFQIESRAQMSMLPRLRPERFYDLVVEVAIVRPGPIQGGMVHPYLRRRRGTEPVDYPHPKLEAILRRTLGVPLFQEQVMRMAVEVAGFSPGEADELRRAMGAWRRTGRMHELRDRLVAGLRKNGLGADFAERIYRQIEGFGEYGFPESHAISFALLAYASAYLKRHHPAAFACALLNSQPMGFYSADTIVRDLQRHGVSVLPPDVTQSSWDSTLEGEAVRLGMRVVRSLGEAAKRRIEEASSPESVGDFASRTRLDKGALASVAQAGAFSAFAPRRQALWQVLRPAPEGLPLEEDPEVALPAESEPEEVAADYAATGLSTRRHPMAFLRERLSRKGVLAARDLARVPHGTEVAVAGAVLVRQHPSTAKGFVFLSLEDETGIANVVLTPQVFSAFRRAAVSAAILLVAGPLQNVEGVIHVRATSLRSLSLHSVPAAPSRDFR